MIIGNYGMEKNLIKRTLKHSGFLILKKENLKIGDAAKVILEIESEKEDGEIIIEGERGYLIVSEIIGDKYIGILDFQPVFIEKGLDNTYLCFCAEIPFSYEHAINICRPPEDPIL
jgi:hypothetical protein